MREWQVLIKYFNNPQLHVTKIQDQLVASFQLRKRDFKTEKYGRFSMINICLSDWNQLQKHLKTNFKDIKRWTNHLLKQHIHNMAKLQKKNWENLPQQSLFYLLYLYLSLSLNISLFLFSIIISISHFFHPVPGISILKFSKLGCLHPPQLLTISESIQHIQPSGMPSYFVSNYWLT